jgi:hypothetical protein
MEFVPFGQDGIPPPTGKATKCRILFNLGEVVYTKGIEAFNLLNFFLFSRSGLIFNLAYFVIGSHVGY